MTKAAIVLTSGGVDSTTCLAIASAEGYTCHTLAFDYGQKHRAELQAAELASKKFGAKQHIVFPLSSQQFSGSALTDSSVEIPDHQSSTAIPSTYVPARNTIFLSIALGFAEVLQAYHIFIGVSAVDYSHYPDCRLDYIAAFQRVADLATRSSVEGKSFTLHTPIIHLSKAETIRLGTKLGVDYHHTISCYRTNDDGKACGRCDSCMLRKKGFAEANLPDPTDYF